MSAGGRHRLFRLALLLSSLWAVPFALSQEAPTVHVNWSSVGPRPVEEQTRSSVIRDYLRAWQDFNRAFEDNRTDLLDSSFVGRAREKLAEAIQEQQQAGIRTRYTPSTHDIDVTFYSSEGLSIELVDTVDYAVEIGGQGINASERLRSRYVAVLTPTEVRWKVRIWQAAAPE